MRPLRRHWRRTPAPFEGQVGTTIHTQTEESSCQLQVKAKCQIFDQSSWRLSDGVSMVNQRDNRLLVGQQRLLADSISNEKANSRQLTHYDRLATPPPATNWLHSTGIATRRPISKASSSETGRSAKTARHSNAIDLVQQARPSLASLVLLMILAWLSGSFVSGEMGGNSSRARMELAPLSAPEEVASEHDLLAQLLHSAGSPQNVDRLIETILGKTLPSSSASGADYEQVRAGSISAATAAAAADDNDDQHHHSVRLLDEVLLASAASGSPVNHQVLYDDEQSAASKAAVASSHDETLRAAANQLEHLLNSRAAKHKEHTLAAPAFSSFAAANASVAQANGLQPLPVQVRADLNHELSASASASVASVIERPQMMPDESTSEALNNNESISTLIIRAAQPARHLIANYSHWINHERPLKPLERGSSAAMHLLAPPPSLLTTVVPDLVPAGQGAGEPSVIATPSPPSSEDEIVPVSSRLIEVSARPAPSEAPELMELSRSFSHSARSNNLTQVLASPLPRLASRSTKLRQAKLPSRSNHKLALNKNSSSSVVPTIQELETTKSANERQTSIASSAGEAPKTLASQPPIAELTVHQDSPTTIVAATTTPFQYTQQTTKRPSSKRAKLKHQLVRKHAKGGRKAVRKVVAKYDTTSAASSTQITTTLETRITPTVMQTTQPVLETTRAADTQTTVQTTLPNDAVQPTNQADGIESPLTTVPMETTLPIETSTTPNLPQYQAEKEQTTGDQFMSDTSQTPPQTSGPTTMAPTTLVEVTTSPVETFSSTIATTDTELYSREMAQTEPMGEQRTATAAAAAVEQLTTAEPASQPTTVAYSEATMTGQTVEQITTPMPALQDTVSVEESSLANEASTSRSAKSLNVVHMFLGTSSASDSLAATQTWMPSREFRLRVPIHRLLASGNQRGAHAAWTERLQTPAASEPPMRRSTVSSSTLPSVWTSDQEIPTDYSQSQTIFSADGGPSSELVDQQQQQQQQQQLTTKASEQTSSTPSATTNSVRDFTYDNLSTTRAPTSVGVASTQTTSRLVRQRTNLQVADESARSVGVRRALVELSRLVASPASSTRAALMATDLAAAATISPATSMTMKLEPINQTLREESANVRQATAASRQRTLEPRELGAALKPANFGKRLATDGPAQTGQKESLTASTERHSVTVGLMSSEQKTANWWNVPELLFHNGLSSPLFKYTQANRTGAHDAKSGQSPSFGLPFEYKPRRLANSSADERPNLGFYGRYYDFRSPNEERVDGNVSNKHSNNNRLPASSFELFKSAKGSRLMARGKLADLWPGLIDSETDRKQMTIQSLSSPLTTLPFATVAPSSPPPTAEAAAAAAAAAAATATATATTTTTTKELANANNRVSEPDRHFTDKSVSPAPLATATLKADSGHGHGYRLANPTSGFETPAWPANAPKKRRREPPQLRPSTVSDHTTPAPTMTSETEPPAVVQAELRPLAGPRAPLGNLFKRLPGTLVAESIGETGETVENEPKRQAQAEDPETNPLGDAANRLKRRRESPATLAGRTLSPTERVSNVTISEFGPKSAISTSSKLADGLTGSQLAAVEEYRTRSLVKAMLDLGGLPNVAHSQLPPARATTTNHQGANEGRLVNRNHAIDLTELVRLVKLESRNQASRANENSLPITEPSRSSTFSSVGTPIGTEATRVEPVTEFNSQSQAVSPVSSKSWPLVATLSRWRSPITSEVLLKPTSLPAPVTSPQPTLTSSKQISTEQSTTPILLLLSSTTTAASPGNRSATIDEGRQPVTSGEGSRRTISSSRPATSFQGGNTLLDTEPQGEMSSTVEESAPTERNTLTSLPALTSPVGAHPSLGTIQSEMATVAQVPAGESSSVSSTLIGQTDASPPTVTVTSVARSLPPAKVLPSTELTSGSHNRSTSVVSLDPNSPLQRLNESQRVAILGIGACCGLLVLCLLVVALSIKCRSCLSSWRKRTGRRHQQQQSNRLARLEERRRRRVALLARQAKQLAKLPAASLLQASDLSTSDAGQLFANSSSLDGSTTSVCMSTSSEGINFVKSGQQQQQQHYQHRRPLAGWPTDKLRSNLLDPRDYAVPRPVCSHLSDQKKASSGERGTDRRALGYGMTLRQRISGTITSRLLRLHLPRLWPYMAYEQQLAQQRERDQHMARRHHEARPKQSLAHSQQQLEQLPDSVPDLPELAAGQPRGLLDSSRAKNGPSNQQQSHRAANQKGKCTSCRPVPLLASSSVQPEVAGQLNRQAICTGNYNRARLPFGAASSVLATGVHTNRHRHQQHKFQRLPGPLQQVTSRQRQFGQQQDDASVQHSQLDNEHHHLLIDEPNTFSSPKTHHHYLSSAIRQFHRPPPVPPASEPVDNVVYDETEELKMDYQEHMFACGGPERPSRRRLADGQVSNCYLQREATTSDNLNSGLNRNLELDSMTQAGDEDSDNYYNLEAAAQTGLDLDAHSASYRLAEGTGSHCASNRHLHTHQRFPVDLSASSSSQPMEPHYLLAAKESAELTPANGPTKEEPQHEHENTASACHCNLVLYPI